MLPAMPDMTDEGWRNIALLMAANCVRNTVVEDYHAAGKISDDEMRAFNREVANKIFTFLHYAFATREHRAQFMARMMLFHPSNWDRPQLCPEWKAAAETPMSPALQQVLQMFQKGTSSEFPPIMELAGLTKTSPSSPSSRAGKRSKR